MAYPLITFIAVYKALTGLEPNYISNTRVSYEPISSLRSSGRLQSPRVNAKVGNMLVVGIASPKPPPRAPPRPTTISPLTGEPDWASEQLTPAGH